MKNGLFRFFSKTFSLKNKGLRVLKKLKNGLSSFFFFIGEHGF